MENRRIQIGMQESKVQKMKSQMHGRGITQIGDQLVNNMSNLMATGEAKTRKTLDTVFRIPTFYYHHGKKLR